MTAVWMWHIFAALVGVVLSLSIFYRGLERVFGVHQELSRHDVVRIVGETGQELSDEEQAAFLTSYNRLVYLGRGPQGRPAASGVTVYLRSGDRLHISQEGKFFNVCRVKKNGKTVHYQLFDRSQDSP